jgi:HAMP domain-containing protein
MNLLTKFSLVYAGLFVVMLCAAGSIAYTVLASNARSEVQAQARMITEYASAARTYTNDQIAPIGAINRNGAFRSQWIPYYGATQIFKYIQSSYRDYTYKEAALNPTNFRDRAVDWETEIINEFRAEPALKMLTGDRAVLGGSALYVASPIVVTAACLSCHGMSAAAPRGMTAIYGTANGFGWKSGEIIGAEIVSVPTSIPLSVARDAFGKMMIALVVVAAIALAVLDLVLTSLVLRPIKRMALQAVDISQGRIEGDDILVKGQDEIAELAQAFNRMTRSLSKVIKLLDESRPER